MLSPREKIIWFAVLTRLFIILLSAIFNFIIPDHDAGVFQIPQNPNDKIQSTFDLIVKYIFGGLIRWDAQYYIHIAMYGYTYENCLAFFPFFPMGVRILAESLYHIIDGFASRYSIYILSAVIINFLVFVLSVSVLHKLSLQVLRNEHLAYKACILYCINPASIFFVAPYSESLFACLTFYGMLKCGTGSNNAPTMGSGLTFGLAALQRSNGILNIGFIFHEKLKRFLKFVIPDLCEKAKCLTSLFLAPLLLIPPLIAIISFLGEAVLSITPFLIFQGYGYYKFCVISNHNLPDFIVSFANANNLKLPGTNLLNFENHWCKKTIPFAYSYIQDYYWNVGFLRYYEWKQIPNFLLAFPIVWVILSNSLKFIKENRQLCYTLGLWDDLCKDDNPKVTGKLNSELKCCNNIKFPRGMFVYVVHVVILTIFCVLCIHVQVTTRMIASASPVLYWFTAYLFFQPQSSMKEEISMYKDKNAVHLASRFRFLKISSSKKETGFGEVEVDSRENLQSKWKVFILTEKNQNPEAKIIKFYYLGYIIIGTALFSNFFPWT